MQLLLIHLVRDPATLNAALSPLAPELFNPQTEALESAVWRTAADVYRRTSQLLNPGIFVVAVEQTLHTYHPDYPLQDGEIEAVAKLIFGFDEKFLNYQLIQPWLQRFLLDRKTSPLVYQLTAPGNELDIELIAQLQQAASESQLSGVTVADLSVIGDEEFKSMERQLTGFRPLDELVGGIRKGEVIALLGPMKGGKTSFCHTLTSEYIQLNVEPRLKVTFFSYEEPVAIQKMKLYVSFLKTVHRDLVEGKSFKDIPPHVQTALTKARPIIGEQVTLVDMSGAQPGQGYGGAAELSTVFAEFARRKTLGSLVIIDHALPLVTNYMTMRRMDVATNMRHQLSELANTVKVLAAKHDVCILLCHQMDSAGNKKSALYKPTHMDAAECKLFAQYPHHILCLGTKDPQTSVSWLNLSASRTRPNAACHVKIEGEYCRVTPAPGFIADVKSGGFLADSAMLSAGDEESGRKPARVPPPIVGATECDNV